MTEEVFLVKPTMQLKEAYLDFYKEWKDSNEDMVPWVICKDPYDFPKMLQFLASSELEVKQPDGWVANSTYWLVTALGKVVGAVNIRHQLTEKLFGSGGHIGYGIRPSERHKGYAAILLEQALQKAREVGIERALLVCNATNSASEKVIRTNGGEQDVSFTEPDGNIVYRFWINTNRV